MGYMKKVVCFSGGKDSTAMLLLLIERNISFDEIVYFDAGPWEFPQMKEHINLVEKHIGRKIIRLRPEKSFSYWMWEHWPDRKHKQPALGKSWPSPIRRWCTRVKAQTIDKYCSDSLRYIGFSYDELKRCDARNIQKLSPFPRFPLIEWKMSEKDCLNYCYDNLPGAPWGGLYEYFPRVSCWCCPLQPISSLFNLWKFFPKLWKKLKLMDNATWQQFRKDYSVEELEKRFHNEIKQLMKIEEGAEKNYQNATRLKSIGGHG
jgi:3'-phosphoadenosine 5'-phosphosulfate sulfotransferase (PAPS reductase)/FAD synthetase